MRILALDVGTTESGFCLIKDNYTPLFLGKVSNIELLNFVKNWKYDLLVYEQFKSYGMPIGDTTIKSIEWNGRFIQCAKDKHKPVCYITRQQEKINICHSSKANDATIKRALIDRFANHDFRTGKGTKNNKDWFFGFANDAWSAYAVAITFLDLREQGEIYECL